MGLVSIVAVFGIYPAALFMEIAKNQSNEIYQFMPRFRVLSAVRFFVCPFVPTLSSLAYLLCSFGFFLVAVRPLILVL
jgi:hypothetical protein